MSVWVNCMKKWVLGLPAATTVLTIFTVFTNCSNPPSALNIRHRTQTINCAFCVVTHLCATRSTKKITIIEQLRYTITGVVVANVIVVAVSGVVNDVAVVVVVVVRCSLWWLVVVRCHRKQRKATTLSLNNGTSTVFSLTKKCHFKVLFTVEFLYHTFLLLQNWKKKSLFLGILFLFYVQYSCYYLLNFIFNFCCHCFLAKLMKKKRKK